MTDRQGLWRLSLDGEVVFRPAGSILPPVSAVLGEVHVNTITFITSEKLSLKTELELTITVSQQSDPLPVRASVLSQQPFESKFLFLTEVFLLDLDPVVHQRLKQYIGNTTDIIKLKRQHVRCPLVTKITYRLRDIPERDFHGVSGDVSVDGMKALIQHEIPPNAGLEISFDLPRNYGRISGQGAVVWEQKKMHGVYVVGMRFQELSSRFRELILTYIRNTLKE